MTSSMNLMSKAMESKILSTVWTVIESAYLEILLFFVAMVTYMILFSNQMPNRGKKGTSCKLHMHAQERDEGMVERRLERKLSFGSVDVRLGSLDQVEKSLKDAYEAGDHRAVLRCWHAFKQYPEEPDVHLPHTVESMQRLKKDNTFVLREIKDFFKRFPGKCDMTVMNDILESLGKRFDSRLMELMIETFPSLKLIQDKRTYEIILTMHHSTRSFQEVKDVVQEMKAKRVPFTMRATIVLIKVALRMNEFDEALIYFRELKATWDAHSAWDSSPSAAPRYIVQQLTELACKEHVLDKFLPELDGVPLSEECVNAMLADCMRQRDAKLLLRVEKLARDQDAKLSTASYSLLVKGFAGDPRRVRAIVDEVIANSDGAECTADFALSVLGLCARTSDVGLANRLFEHAQPKQLPVVNAFIRFYAENEHFTKACDIYERSVRRADADGQRTILTDSRMERSLMAAALRCGRTSLAQQLLKSSPSDVAKHIAMIRSCAAENNLEGATSAFEALKQSGMDLNSVVYNTVLDACVQCQNLKAAEAWMEKIKEAGMADVVSFNTLIKAHLMGNHLKKARGLMEEMKASGIQPNRVTFNELIHAAAQCGGRSNDIWDILKEMKAVGINPNQVTCSILLKSLHARSNEEDILMTMELIKGMEEPMDEVLLSSIVEACVRIGKPDLLADRLQQLQDNKQVAVNGSHTFGSLIKAYGHAKDIQGVWRCWKEMRSRHIRPTSITLGCMVEAVVSNGDTEGAYELIHQMCEDEQCRSALNSVIFCSVLKGFTREKKIDRVFAVYKEMNQRKVELSIVTYNTIIDACARCGRMDHVPEIMADMAQQSIKPNVITFSTTLKGHCQNGSVHLGFAVLEKMRRETTLKPDEIMYNSLLDGCAQNNLVEEALGLLDEMQKEGVQPSNFTLSVLVKLMGRARKIANAFSIVEELSKKYRFKPNVHVYANLIQACISNRNLPKALNVLETMIRERVQPDNRTYALLVRASLSHNQFEQAVSLLRAALGLPRGWDAGGEPSMAVCSKLESDLVQESLTHLVDRSNSKDLAVSLLADIKQLKPKVRIDAVTQHRVMSSVSQAGSTGRSIGNGGRNSKFREPRSSS
mmetsp:Transcript_146127/g.269691  ORF Transcript_146127/g.269691 Transcript_146127/m.269691 type:complete len:1103 (+) Transcript_146127:138-3446(+)